MNLNDRIKNFLRGRDGVESIDKVTHIRKKGHTHKADYLMRGRTIVAELKSLQTDTTEKVQKKLEAFGITLPSARYRLDQVIARRPDAAEIEHEVRRAVHTSTRNHVFDADAQIRDTIVNLDLAAEGLLILVNCVPGLTPSIVENAIRCELSESRLEHIQAIWFLSESFPPEFGDAAVAYASLFVEELARPASQAATEHIRQLNIDWRAHRSYPPGVSPTS